MVILADGFTHAPIPFHSRSEGIQILIRAAVYSGVRGANHAAKAHQRLFIDLVARKQFHVVTKIAKKPIQFPERSLGAIEATGKGLRFGDLWIQHHKSKAKKRLLRMPAIRSVVNAYQKQAVQIAFDSLLSQMEAWDMAPHGLTCVGWA